MWWSTRGHKWRHNMAHTLCMLDKQAYMHVHTCTRPRVRVHALTHAHTDQWVILIAFPRQQLFANAPQCYVVRTLPVFFYLSTLLLNVWHIPLLSTDFVLVSCVLFTRLENIHTVSLSVFFSWPTSLMAVAESWVLFFTLFIFSINHWWHQHLLTFLTKVKPFHPIFTVFFVE